MLPPQPGIPLPPHISNLVQDHQIPPQARIQHAQNSVPAVQISTRAPASRTRASVPPIIDPVLPARLPARIPIVQQIPDQHLQIPSQHSQISQESSTSNSQSEFSEQQEGSKYFESNEIAQTDFGSMHITTQSQKSVVKILISVMMGKYLEKLHDKTTSRVDRERQKILFRNWLAQNYSSWVISYDFIRQSTQSWITRLLKNLRSEWLFNTITTALEAVSVTTFTRSKQN